MMYKICNNIRLWDTTKPPFTIWRSKSNFYDVLNLNQNCSSEEIRQSYLKLSKLYHPDKLKNTKAAHQNFVEINEAYNTLSKPESRRNYDYTLAYPQYSTFSPYEYGPGVPPNPIFRRRKKANDSSEEESYYGIKGVKKTSNLTVLAICIIIAVLGVSVQILLIRNSFTFRRNKMEKENEKSQELLEVIRDRSQRLGNEYQIELLRQKMEENEMKRGIN